MLVPPQLWTIENVCYWISTLSDIPTAEIAAKLRENAVDGSVLLQLNEEDLRSGLGITALGHRKKLMNYIQELRSLAAGGYPATVEQQFECLSLEEQHHHAAAISTADSTSSQPQSQLYELNEDNMDESAAGGIAPAPGALLVSCPTRNCVNVVEWHPQQDSPHFRCDKCQQHYCLACRVPMHHGMTCLAYRRLQKNETIEAQRRFELKALPISQ